MRFFVRAIYSVKAKVVNFVHSMQKQRPHTEQSEKRFVKYNNSSRFEKA